MSICLYILENSVKYFRNLMNLGEIYIFLYQQFESGKRLFLQLFDTFLNIKIRSVYTIRHIYIKCFEKKESNLIHLRSASLLRYIAVC